jgi:hypothetical protein
LGKKIIKASGKILKKIKKKEPSYVRSLKKLRSNYNKSSTTILFKPE